MKLRFIKVGKDRYMIENSNNTIVNEKEIKNLIAVQDINTNGCVKELYEGDLGESSRSESIVAESNSIEETATDSKPDKVRKRK